MTRVEGASRRTVVLFVLFVLAMPGYVLLLRDLVRASPEEILRQVESWRMEVAEASVRFQVDPALIVAVIAVESRSDPEAVSKRGARGLMQLMPTTARETAKMLNEHEPDEEDLLEPETSILLGTAYLRWQLEKYEDVKLALAAYNAGPGNVDRWLEESPLDWTVDEVLRKKAFEATRDYIERVLTYKDLVVREGGWDR